MSTESDFERDQSYVFLVSYIFDYSALFDQDEDRDIEDDITPFKEFIHLPHG